MSKHTPGPWMLAAKPSSIVGWPVVAQSGRAIASLNYVHQSMIDPPVKGDRAYNVESKANGALIAAAPDLFKALEAIQQFCDDPDGSEKPESLAMGLARLLPAARAALAKAKGETT